MMLLFSVAIMTHFFVKNRLERALVVVSNWCQHNFININVGKTRYCIYGLRSKVNLDSETSLKFGNQQINKCHQYKYLGVHLDECMNLNSNFNAIFKKILL